MTSPLSFPLHAPLTHFELTDSWRVLCLQAGSWQTYVPKEEIDVSESDEMLTVVVQVKELSQEEGQSVLQELLW